MATAFGHSWPSIWRRVLYPHSPFGLVARLSATHKRDKTVSGPPQSPTRSLEDFVDNQQLTERTVGKFNALSGKSDSRVQIT